MYFINWFKKPYYFINSPKFNFILSFGVGFFIFLFLFLFQPFGITSLLNNKLLYTGGFGIVSFIITGFYFLLLPLVFKKFFKDENWTIGKNIIFLFFLIFTITFGNFYFNSFVQNTKNTELLSLKDFFVYTFSLSIFPIIIFTYISEKLYRIYREKSSKEIMRFKTSNRVEKKDNKVHLFGDNKKENLSFNINDLIYITSQGNYASLFLKTEKGIEEKVLRNTLSNINKLLSNNTNIVRCHKSYIVNTSFVDSISGNARGYFLESNLISKQIPVSRRFTKQDLKNLIS